MAARDIGATSVDITQLILDDHHEQRRLFALLEEIGSKDKTSLAAIWGRLSAFLEVHAEAEDHAEPEEAEPDRRGGTVIPCAPGSAYMPDRLGPL